MNTQQSFDAAQVIAFVEQVFQSTDPIELRATRTDHNRGHIELCLAGQISDASILSWIEAHNGPAWAVYIGANPRKPGPGSGKGGAAEDIDVPFARSVFVDFDDIGPAAAVERIAAVGLPAPTLLIDSGRPDADGCHAYWILESPIHDMALWAGFQRTLINLLKSDKTIKNPSRIMRLPGTFNYKRGGLCRILQTGDRFKSVEDLRIQATPEPELTRPALDPTIPASMDRLSRDTLLFLAKGCDPGNRNNALFAAACDMAGNNFDFETAFSLLQPKATESGLAPAESEGVIRRAFGRPRTPTISAPEPITPELIAALNADRGYPAQAQPIANDQPDRPITQPKIGRSVVSNVTVANVSQDGKIYKHVYAKPVEQVAAEMVEALGGWPRRSNATGLFTLKQVGQNDCEVWPILDPSALFAAIHHHAGVHWSEGEAESVDGKPASPVTKREFFMWCKDNVDPCYQTIATLPHHPPRPGTYYLPCNLPAPTGERLAELLDRLNPETELDRSLMLAALLTPGWGGPLGARPMFIFASDYGQGSGKTETAKAIGRVWGGAIPLDYDEDWANVCKRIMSSNDSLARVFLFDNVRGRFGTAAIEAAVTSESITGHRMYVGTINRPNDATFFLTFNMPELTRDVAQRAVIIKMGRPSGAGFVEWVHAFMSEHRLQLVADLLAILQGPDKSVVRPSNRDRWAAWQSGVLQKLENGDELARFIIARRPEAETGVEETEDITAAVSRYLVRRGRTAGSEAPITSTELYRVMVGEGLFLPEMNRPPRSNQTKCAHLLNARLSGRGVLLPFRESPGGPVTKVTVDQNGVMQAKHVKDTYGRASLYRWIWAQATAILGQPANKLPDTVPAWESGRGALSPPV
jgi:hypothetical protein